MRSVLALTIVQLCAAAASAHAIPRALLAIDDVDARSAMVTLTSTNGADPALSIAFPADCASLARSTSSWRIECARLDGATLAVGGLGTVVGELVVREGARTALLTSSQPRFVLHPVGASEHAGVVAGDFVHAGLAHILFGYDHLLFLLLLVVVVRKWRAVLLAETAFTLSHSLSFTLAATGVVHANVAATEACIALSLLLMALEAPRAPRLLFESCSDLAPTASGHELRQQAGGAAGPMAALCFAFGLVHGLGFAGGLADVGLPDHHVALALASFAIGVELGQVSFLVVALAIFACASRIHLGRRGRAERISLDGALSLVITYAGGALSCAWLFARVATLFSGASP